MMETLKRHVFLLGLVGGVVVLSLVIGLTAYLVYTRPAASMFTTLRSTETSAKRLLPPNPLYTAKAVEDMTEQVKDRQKQYEDILSYIRDLGHKRKSLDDALFPKTTDNNLLLRFKSLYDKKLAEFIKRLNGVEPIAPDKNASDKTAKTPETPVGALYISPKLSFARPDWVDKPEPPKMDEVLSGQEDIWLMEDLVDLLARMNDELRAKGQEPRIQDSAIKELDEIRIGGPNAVLAGTKMPTLGSRYMSVSKGPGSRAPALPGRWTVPAFYKVLPFRLTVIVESRYSGELVRRLKGTESFITVDAVRERPVVEARDCFAANRKDYGTQGIVRMEIVAESLVFQLEGGRITTPGARAPSAAPGAKAPGAAPAAPPAGASKG